MHIEILTTNAVQTADAVEDLRGQLADRQIPRAPDFCALHFNADLDTRALVQAALDCGPALHGASSCLGVMSHGGIHRGAGAFCIWDEAGSYGSAMCPMGDDPAAAAAQATRAALASADRVGDAPDILWLSATPGTEERVLQGIQSVVGHNVPIMGGSAADNTVSGDWKVLGTQGDAQAGVVVSVLFPSTKVSFAYHNGYVPTERFGRVTRANGRRLIEIEGRPAIDVYNDWTGGLISARAISAPVSILADSTFFPLGRFLESVDGVPYYLLAHPATVHPDGSISLFSEVQVGDELTLMQGSVRSLTARAGKVARHAMQLGEIDRDKVAGGLMVYCGGCMLAVQDHMQNTVNGVRATMGAAPFLGVFTFGEQGRVQGEVNQHGNLMISCIIFSK